MFFIDTNIWRSANFKRQAHVLSESGGRNGQKINPAHTGSILVIYKRLRQLNRSSNSFADRHAGSYSTHIPCGNSG